MSSILSRIRATDSLPQWAEKINLSFDFIENYAQSSGNIVNSITPANTQLIVWNTTISSWSNATLIGPITIDPTSFSSNQFSFKINPPLISNLNELSENDLDRDNDFFMVLDASASEIKKIKLSSQVVTPGGSNTNVQFNDFGSFGGSSGLTFDKTTNNLSVSNNVLVGNRIGVNNSNPAYAIDVTGSVNTTTGYRINGTQVLTSTTLGSTVTTSSLTSLGVLTSLSVSGTANFNSSLTANAGILTTSITINNLDGTSQPFLYLNTSKQVLAARGVVDDDYGLYFHSSVGIYNRGDFTIWSRLQSNSSYGLIFAKQGNTTSKTGQINAQTKIGGIYGTGWDETSNFRAIAGIEIYSNGTVTSTSSPGYILFATTPAGSINMVERVRISSNGYVGIKNTLGPSLIDSTTYRLVIPVGTDRYAT